VRIINFPIDQAYQHVLEFLESSEVKKTIGDVKIVDRKQPSHIRVKMNRWISKVYLSTLNIGLASVDENSRIEFNFDFSNLKLFYISLPIIFLLTVTYLNWNWITAHETITVLLFIGSLALYALFIAFICYRYIRKKVKDFIDIFDSFFRLDMKIEDGLNTS